jgi:hypothetical protein
VTAGFTPGPLVVRVMPDKEIYIFEGPEGDMGQSVLEGGFVLHDDDENLANALLWAAAPELYEAVQALVECFVRRGPFDEPLGSSEQAPSITAGIAALAKARGES